MKTILGVMALVSLSGCANLNGWEHGTRLLDRGPIVYQLPQSQSNGVSDIRTGTTTYNLPTGTFQVNRVGNTVSVIQTSK